MKPANAKPVYTAPTIIESFVDDEGEINFVLSNGRTQLKTAYEQLWEPKRGIINWKTKGENPDRTKIK